MKDSSRQVLSEGLRKASAKILLNPDGTFVASEMPGLFESPGQRDIRLEGGSGSWKLVVSDGRQELQLDFYAIANWRGSKLPYGTHLDVSRNWGEASLFYFVGDADEARRIEFDKK